jgi:UDP-glucuronate 4-epimerase
LHVIACLEQALGMPIEKELVAMQPDGVPAIYANIDELTRDTGFRLTTSIGIERFAAWHRDV